MPSPDTTQPPFPSLKTSDLLQTLLQVALGSLLSLLTHVAWLCEAEAVI